MIYMYCKPSLRKLLHDQSSRSHTTINESTCNHVLSMNSDVICDIQITFTCMLVIHADTSFNTQMNKHSAIKTFGMHTKDNQINKDLQEQYSLFLRNAMGRWNA